MITPYKYDYACGFDDETAIVKLNRKWGAIIQTSKAKTAKASIKCLFVDKKGRILGDIPDELLLCINE